jgi:SpoVK/Ycf46/Vps4 family AAA+-type ATPase
LEGAALKPSAQHFPALSAACRRIACPDLPRFARRIEPIFCLDDVVLPADRRAQLNEMVAQVVYASKVLNTWGFSTQLPYGRGVAALFCGPSGTGKSMAAQAIARELQTDTYVVDLSRVVSKYIGESEKNLDAVFNDAERAGAVLLFDEADALFGKRSEVKDAHDRYANIEVAYLLQRMEAFAGLAILTTNFRQNLDSAFLRRLRFVVEFPKPDSQAREAIWRQCLPEAAPRQGDIDFRFLARRLELTGGNIRQITLRAAFAAASEKADAIEMRHVVTATRAELIKLGMQSAERELADFEAAERRLATQAA